MSRAELTGCLRTIKDCPRCAGTHADLLYRPFKRVILTAVTTSEKGPVVVMKGTEWAMCPETGEPIHLFQYIRLSHRAYLKLAAKFAMEQVEP